MPKVFKGTARKWIFTDNAKTKTDDELRGMLHHEHVCLIEWGNEVAPETKKEHRQGRVQFDMPVRIAHVQKVVGNKCHAQPERDSEKSRAYIRKDGDVISAGTELKQGERTDIRALHEDVKQGKSTLELGDLHTNAWYKYSNSVTKMQKAIDLSKKPAFAAKEVYLIVGKPGWGKSHLASCQYGADNVCQLNEKQFKSGFWDHYNGEDIIQLDDFNGTWMKHEELLNLLDGYPIWVNVKHGGMWSKHTKVVITSNIHWTKWYSTLWEKFPDLYEALKRRVTKATQMTEPYECEHTRRAGKHVTVSRSWGNTRLKPPNFFPLQSLRWIMAWVISRDMTTLLEPKDVPSASARVGNLTLKNLSYKQA